MSDTAKAVTGPASYFPSIEKKYGRPIAAWQEVLRSHPGYASAKHGELVAFLKTEHALGHGHANALVAHTLREDRG
ncbi:DUF4287 domain-containing protein [Pimelobacter simplex]|uniref:Uncharacterized protein n=1 Tax=Nocardioides simplex TaxID=2045 RepID=A0A0A1DVS7_NOCSI|nr:DUF4287 domain-containing protein [Pimelobacter simplex]AIY19530.1 hypothetical protein KR76_27140 [Pimelobacter simplex]MCG8150808.1 DUF4287 domain-containing protein [Pimelobacter simplex]GEB15327.1 hypothetical protein NSI01_36420 [Pimelobacter simplex]SFM83561.1 protein of unknown function [Pimelobacter simplex]